MAFSIGSFVTTVVNTGTSQVRNLTYLAVSGVFAFGAILGYNGGFSNAHNAKADIAVPLLMRETGTGATSNGQSASGAQTITFVATDGSLVTLSGGVLIGPLGTYNVTLTNSGITIRPKGGAAALTTAALNVAATMSGRNLVIEGTGASPLIQTLLGNSWVGIGKVPKAPFDVLSLSGATVKGMAMTGGVLTINKQGAGSGKLTVHGSAGSYICLWDAGASGWKQASIKNGAWILNIANATTCP